MGGDAPIDAQDPRALIEVTVRARATRRTRDQVGDTRSFGTMENSGDRGFVVGLGEWRTAEEQVDRYAFLIVVRAPSGPPQAVELLPDPQRLLDDRRFIRTPEGWQVRYQLDTSSPE